MIQLRVLSGRNAGQLLTAKRLPLSVGRAPTDELRFEDEGVWAKHAEFFLGGPVDIHVRAHEQALTTVNGQPVRTARIRNGDVVEIGAVRLSITLGPTPPRSFRLREALTWWAFAAWGAVQLVALARWLP